MAVPVSTDANFSMGSAKRLFEHSGLANTQVDPMYDVSPDGRRFVVPEAVGPAPEPSIQVVQNWYAEFRDREQD